MSPEYKRLRELTPDEIETGDIYIRECRLEEHASTPVVMHEQIGTLRDGLGHSSPYIEEMGLGPEEVRIWALTIIREQAGMNLSLDQAVD